MNRGPWKTRTCTKDMMLKKEERRGTKALEYKPQTMPTNL